MEAQKPSRKRKLQSAPVPLNGVLTRSQPQQHHQREYRHRLRAGRPPKSRRGRGDRKPSHGRGQPFGTDALSRPSIKDLRARRVFSPFSSVLRDSSAVIGDETGEYSDVITLSANGDDEKSTSRVPFGDGSLGSGDKHGDMGGYPDDLRLSNHGDVARSVNRVSRNPSGGECLDSVAIHQCFSGGKDGVIGGRSNLLTSTENSEKENPVISAFSSLSADKSSDSCSIGDSSHVDKVLEAAEHFDAPKPSMQCGVQESRIFTSINGNLDTFEAGGDHTSVKDGEISNKVNHCSEVRFQSTPPEDVFDKPETGHDGETRAASAYQNLGRGLITPSGGSCDDLHSKHGPSKITLPLRPCSRPKLFKQPHSFSYRRLLPYLMEIADPKSGTSVSDPCPTLEKLSEPMSSEPPVFSQCDENPDNNCGADGLSTVHQLSNSDSLVPNAGTNMNISSGDNEANSVSPQHMPQSLLIPDSGNNSASDITEKCVSIQSTVVEPMQEDPSAIQETESAVSLTALSVVMNSEILTVEPFAAPAEGGCFIPAPGTVPVNATDSTPNNPEIEASIRPVSALKGDIVRKGCFLPAPDTEPMTVTDLPLNISEIKTGIRPASDFRSVLKRNPRGCRGLCTCLSCASFRLHAERSFQFTRNQMQDAEEVSMELINELTCLRFFLEKSTVTSNGYAIQKTNEVEEACSKAHLAEEIAKARLAQMNDDLSHHSRTQSLHRPRVKFANNVEERLIPKIEDSRRR